MRVSLVALSALTALISHELIRTDAVTPNSAPAPAKPGSKTAAQPASTTKPQPLSSIARPETLPSPQSMKSGEGANQQLSLSDEPLLSLNLNDDWAKPLELPPPPTISNAAFADQPLSVDQLPIDAIVADSIRPGSQQTAVAVANSPLNSTADAKPTKQAPEQPPEPTPFADIQNHPAKETISALLKRGVIKGFPDGTFRPDRFVTDGEFKGMIQKALKNPGALAQVPPQVASRADAAQFVYQQVLAAEGKTAQTVRVDQKAEAQRPEVQMATIASASEPQISKQKLPELAPGLPLASTDFPPASTPASNLALNTAVLSKDEESYTLGPGDRIRIEIFNVPEYSKDYQVLVNGSVNLYRVGNIPIEGLTLKQAEQQIAARYNRLVKRPLVDVNLTTPRPLNVGIAGEVGRPGSYTMALTEGGKFPTVTRLIQQAGGMTQSANPRQVIVTRPQRSGTNQVINVNLWELFQTGNLRQDLTLRDGDTIFIPPKTEVNLAEASQLAAANFATDNSQPLNIAVVGQVARPGPYVLTKSGGLPTITQAIQQAGGITGTADIRGIEVRRATRTGTPQSIRIDLWKLLNSGDLSQDLVLQQGDTVSIPVATALNTAEASQLGTASFAPTSVKVNIVGEVVKPGVVEVPPNTPLNQALLAAGGFNRDARKGTVELIRLNPDGTVSRQAIAIDLAQGIDAKGNPTLRNNDIVVVDRSGGAKFRDSLDSVFGIIQRVLPFGRLF